MQNARVYFSTDYNWVQENKTLSYGARDLIDCFSSQIKKGGQIDWNLAYHLTRLTFRSRSSGWKMKRITTAWTLRW